MCCKEASVKQSWGGRGGECGWTWKPDCSMTFRWLRSQRCQGRRSNRRRRGRGASGRVLRLAQARRPGESQSPRPVRQRQRRRSARAQPSPSTHLPRPAHHSVYLTPGLPPLPVPCPQPSSRCTRHLRDRPAQVTTPCLATPDLQTVPRFAHPSPNPDHSHTSRDVV